MVPRLWWRLVSRSVEGVEANHATEREEAMTTSTPFINYVLAQAYATPRWKAWWVRLVGVRRIVSDGKTVVTMYYWRGVYYVVDQYEEKR
jgi:hypothetical protein